MNMKKLLIVICILANQFINSAKAQAPQSFNYQAVARDAAGAVISNQAVSFRISLLQGSSTGTSVFTETHNVNTNQFGLVNFAIGSGTLLNGSFSTINWANGPYFVQIEIDITGGSNYVSMNTTQLLSIPYALYAETSGSSIPGPQGPAGPQGNDGPIGPQGPAGPQGLPGTYTSGNGIDINGQVITNTLPDQIVTLNGTGQTNITGTYPNYVVNTPNIQAGNGISVSGQTITNTAPDQTVTINGSGQTNVTGNYPNFNINTPNYIAGEGIEISNDSIINTAPFTYGDGKP